MNTTTTRAARPGAPRRRRSALRPGLGATPVAVLLLLLLSAALSPGRAAAGEAVPTRVDVPPARELTPALLREAQELSRHLPPPRIEEEGESEGDEMRLMRRNVNDYPRSTEPAAPMPPATDVRRDDAPGPEAATAFGYQPRLAASFDGLTDVGGPADPNLAVGPGHVLATVNIQLGFYDKQGLLLAQVDERAFFGLPGNTFIFDAKTVYDPGTQRFFVMAISRDDVLFRSYFHLAVSQSSDPTQGWWVWSNLRNDLDTNWIDYPELGVSSRGLYFTGNYLNLTNDPWPPPPQFHGATLWVMNTAAMVAGTGFTIWRFDDLLRDDAQVARFMTPSQAYTTPAGLDNFAVASRNTATVTRWQIYGVTLPANFPTGAPTIARSTLDVALVSTLANAPQLGGPALIETWNVGSPPMNAVYRGGRLWTVLHAPGGAGMMVRHYEFDVAAWPTVTVASTAGFASGTRWYFWPAVTVNSFGDAIMGFSSSATNEYTGARFTERFAGEASFEPSGLLKAGEDYFGTDADDSTFLYRWGDYSGAAVDPSNQGLWVHHKYAATRPDTNTPVWRSWIGYVPRAVFVDVTFGGSPNGTRARPWLTMSQGSAGALPGNDVVVKAGSYPGAITINKAMTILSDGGSAVIGP